MKPGWDHIKRESEDRKRNIWGADTDTFQITRCSETWKSYSEGNLKGLTIEIEGELPGSQEEKKLININNWQVKF